MAKVTADMTVGEIATKYPMLQEIMERMGVDYCCGGKHDLATAATQKGLDLDDVLLSLNAHLDRGPTANQNHRDWNTASLTELTDHIEQKHHAFMKEQLPRIGGKIARIKLMHGEKHGRVLVELEDIYIGLRDEIEAHLGKEEQVLFPYIRIIEAYATRGGEKPDVHCGSVGNPIRQMENEHENTGRALEHIRELTDNYTVPEDGCVSFREAYEGLKAIERDLHEHIHLENNILFPRAKELEQRAGICK